MSTRQRRRLRLLTPVLAVGMALVSLPAQADVPQGWSDPEQVSVLHLLLFILALPLALGLLIAVVFLAPGFARGEGMTGVDDGPTERWFGGRGSAAELEAGGAGSGDTPAITGGASGRW